MQSRAKVFWAMTAALMLLLPVHTGTAAAAETVVHRVNAGGPSLTASPDWSVDTAASPSPLVNAADTGNKTSSTTATIDMTSSTIPAGTPAELFQTERWDGTAAPEMAWDLPMTSGKAYELRLYFAEIYSGTSGAGLRVFDVMVDGALAFDDYDVYVRSGGANKGIVERVRGTSDGNVDVDFVHVIENPAIKAIEVVEVDTSTSPLAAVPSSLSFGSVKTGTTQTQTVSVTNQTGTDGPSITISSTSITGTGATAFSDSYPDDGSVTLTPGSSTPIDVTFAPTTLESLTATLEIHHSGSDSPLTVPLSGTGVDQVPISFGKSVLAGETSSRITSLQFGPDGRLYVAQQDGLIVVYGIERSLANDYSVTSTETITSIQTIPNHDDDGQPNTSVTTRQVTGILVAGTATNPVIYVSSSDPRIGGGSDGTETGLDTNSSMVSRLTWTGSSWSKLDLVRGLPRSEENHSANGLQLDPATNILYLSMGGNTNMGAPSNNFALLPEFALSAAVISIDLNAIGETTYDLPTLDDEDRAGTADANDPFGGNDGKNQAMIVPGGPVQIFNPGFRNPYDLLRTTSGRFYTIDNGANAGWGEVPINEGPDGTCTNGVNEPGTTDVDTFHLVRLNGYGGHPNPTRGNVSNTFNTSNPQSPVPTANAIECDWRAAGPDRGNITAYSASTNGLTEYTASNFDGQLTGDILSASFDNKVYRAKLNDNGTQLVAGEALFSSVGNTPLDVTAQGDSAPFPGTIWVGDIGNGSVVVFEPADYDGATGSTCTGADDSTIDEDGDGFDNADEIANGTDPCSAADVPPDWDGDKTSDLNDPDDDNDTSPDTSDRYAVDPNNGTTTDLPVQFSWDNEPATSSGLMNLGFTGLMTNGTSDYSTLFDANKMTAGGAAGATTVDAVSEGTAAGGTNTQEYGFQVGFMPGTSPFTAHTRVLAPFAGMTPEDGQNMGLFLGDGDQDDYVSLVVAGNSGGGIEFLKESAGATSDGATAAVTLPGPSAVDLYLAVDPATSTVQPSYSLTYDGVVGERTAVGGPVPIPSAWLSGPDAMAVGLISTSAGAAPSFAATWDFLQVVSDGTSTQSLTVTPSTASLSAVQDGAAASTTVTVAADDGSTPEVTTSSDAAWLTVSPVSGTAPVDLAVTADPTGLAAGTYTGTVTATASGYSSAQATITFTVTAQSGSLLYRVNAGGGELAALDDGLVWSQDLAGAPSPYVNAADTGDKTHSTTKSVALHTSVPASTPPALFQTERWDPQPLPEMLWSFPVQDSGPWEVRLYFADIYDGTQGVGKRVFDVTIEGALVLDDYDIYADVGGYTGVMKKFLVDSDGTLDLSILFEHGVENPAINGIEILHAGTSTNTAPTIEPVADQSAVEGDTVSVQVTAADADGDALTYSATGLPTGLSIDTGTGQISGTVAEGTATGSPYTVTATVNDGNGGTASTSFSWTITAPVNTAPTIEPVADQSAVEGDTVSVQVTAADADGDALTYSATGLPTGLSIDTGTGLIGGTVADGAATGSPYTVTATVNDGNGGTASTTFSWTITAPAQSGALLYRVNAGGAELAALDGGLVWSQDLKSAPSPYVNAADTRNKTRSTTKTVALHTSVPASTPPGLFQTERWDPQPLPEMLWSFPVQDSGPWEVRLYFADIHDKTQAVGKRVFDVTIEGALVLDDYDIYADVGGYTGVMKKFLVESDGTTDLSILFEHGVENPGINGIEILHAGT